MEFVLILVIALVVGAVFAFGFRRPGPWPGMTWFFLLMVLGTWAIGSWFQPVGPPLREFYWMPYLIAALLLALLMAAATPPRRRTTGTSSEGEPTRPERMAALGGFFWMLLVLFLLALFARLFQ